MKHFQNSFWLWVLQLRVRLMLLSLLSSMIKSYHNHKQLEESPVGVLEKNDGHFCIDQKGSFAIYRSEKNQCLLFQSLLHVYRKRLMSLQRWNSSAPLNNEKMLINLLIISQYFVCLGFLCNKACNHPRPRHWATVSIVFVFCLVKVSWHYWSLARTDDIMNVSSELLGLTSESSETPVIIQWAPENIQESIDSPRNSMSPSYILF